MRIISGSAKGRRLFTLAGRALRPTADRVKESIFNMLGPSVAGSAVLDLFAGTGNLGIEALSRGAQSAFFVDGSAPSIAIIRKNLVLCAMTARAEVLQDDAFRAIALLRRRRRTFDLLFADPPYEQGFVEKTLKALAVHDIGHGDMLVIIEHTRREPLPDPLDSWMLLRQRKTGDTVVSFLKKGPHTGEGGAAQAAEDPVPGDGAGSSTQ
jgi:16S rRNA (guanine966-N2)-methyltransferase